MGPTTMAEAIREIDDLKQQLELTQKTCDELVRMVDAARTERDSWRARCGA